MLNDIVETVIDILSGILRKVISSKLSKRKKSSTPVKKTAARQQDPWEQHDRDTPWED